MNKKITKFILSILLISFSTSMCFAYYEGMYTQSLSVGEKNPTEPKTESSQNFSYEKLPGEKIKKTVETQDNDDYENMTFSPYYYINNYNNNNIYRIGPYYRNGVYSTGGFNYKGFSYNYGIGKKPIYIKVPVGPLPPPPGQKPPHHKPDTPGNGHHNHSLQK